MDAAKSDEGWTIVITKQEAVIQMIEGAIQSFSDGKLACAITLAAASEEAMPRPLHGLHPNWLDELNDLPKHQKKHILREINAERNWLKHFNEDEPKEYALFMTPFYLLRTMAKFRAVYGKDARSPIMVKVEDGALDLAEAALAALRYFGLLKKHQISVDIPQSPTDAT